MIEILNATKKYRNKIVLNNISFKFENGNSYAIIGVNGSGKTQLMKAICGFTKLNKGEIYQDGKKIRDKYNFINDAGLLVDKVGYLDNLTLLDNLNKIRLINNVCSSNKLMALINYFNLDEYTNVKYHKLSLGNKKRALIIQALMDNPSILILDEPFDSLDEEGVVLLKEYLIKFMKNKKNILLISSHHTSDLIGICDYSIKLDKGRITCFEKIK
ncbi:MAG: ATP-binding cassette domain-containing protein [Methanobrevibacter sp.]|jgi:ABC-2 type transport system ATP-binding protein|nr:ATP-binding cassette domain-containing protein [Candidatus Methanovirga australis]